MKPLPKYVRIGDSKGTALVLEGGGSYYRHAGIWSVRAEWEGDRVVVSKNPGNLHHNHLIGKELVPCTKEAHDEDNEGYLG